MRLGYCWNWIEAAELDKEELRPDEINSVEYSLRLRPKNSDSLVILANSCRSLLLCCQSQKKKKKKKKEKQMIYIVE